MIARLYRYAAEVAGPFAMEDAWHEFHCGNEEKKFDLESPLQMLFGPYFLFGWELDSAYSDCDSSLDGKTLAEAFLDSEGDQLSKEEIAVLQVSNRPIFSFFKILEIKPGTGFFVQNVLTEKEFEIVEKSGSEGAIPGYIIFGAMGEEGGRHQVVGTSPWLLPPLSIQTLIDFRKALKKAFGTRKLSDSQLAEVDFELRQVFFDLLEPVLNPQRPILTNTDEDLLVPQTLYFEIDSPDFAFEKLKVLVKDQIPEEELLEGAEFEGDKLLAVEIPWFKKNKKNTHLSSNILLGRIKILRKKLVVEVNSNKRADTITQKLNSLLGSRVKYVNKVIESIEGNTKEKSDLKTLGSSMIPVEELPPEAEEAIKEMAKRHWEKWYREKIPALNGMTPLQAAKTKEGRELLESLLYLYDDRSNLTNSSQLSATKLFRPNIEEIRKKLGLD